MSKFANRNHRKSESSSRQESDPSGKRRASPNFGKCLNSEKGSQHQVLSTKLNSTSMDRELKLRNFTPNYQSEDSNHETPKREESAKEKNKICLEKGVSDTCSDDFSERSPNINSKAQIAEEVELLIECGLKYYQQKDYKQCILNLEQALNADRENVKTNYWLGMSYYQLLQMDKALKYFIRVSPSNCESGYVETFFWIGEIYRQQQNLSEASENYQKLLSLAPNSTYSASALEHLTRIKFKNLFG